jgi:WD40 repeat protein
MSDVFISYSRKDKQFVEKMYDALTFRGRETWIDWESIEWTEDWWQKIERGIEGANTFVFVISPDSIASEVCRQEIDHAEKHNKRLIPILWRDVPVEEISKALRKLNWAFLREEDDFENGLAKLLKVMDTDLEHVRTHTRLLERAIEWDREERNQSFVLREDDLKRSQIWLVQAEQKEPKPTELQREFIRASQANEKATRIVFEAGQEAERLLKNANRRVDDAVAKEQKATQRAKVASAVFCIALIGAAITGGFAWRAVKDGEEARAGTRIERAGQLALRRFDTDQADGLRLAMLAGFELKKWTRGKSTDRVLVLSPILALQSSLEKIRETKLSSQQSSIYSVAFSPNGRLIATAGKDGTTRLWNINGGSIVTINGRQGSIYSVAFSPDSKFIATGGKDGTTKLWNVNGEIITTINGEQGSIRSVAFSPDSKLATGGDNGSTKLWSIDGKLITTINDDQGSVYSLAFSSDGKIAVSSLKSITNLWNMNGKRIVTINSEQTSIYSVAFSPNNNLVATGGFDGSIKLWDMNGNNISTINTNQGRVYSVAFSPDGKLIVSAGLDGSIKLWRTSGKNILSFNSNQSFVYSAVFSPTGDSIVTGGENGNAKLWSKDSHPIATLNTNQGNISDLAFSSDGHFIATGSKNDAIKIWDTNGKFIRSFSSDGGIRTIAFSPNGRFIAAIGNDGNTKLWDVDGKFIKSLGSQQTGSNFFDGDYDSVFSVTFSPDSQFVVTSGKDSNTKFWDVDGKSSSSLNGNQGFVYGVAFSPDGKLVATGGRDGTTKIWNKNSQLVMSLNGNQGFIYSVVFSSDGELIVTGGKDGTIKIWDKTGKNITTFSGNQGSILRTAFHSNGKFIITSGQDGTTKIWDIDGNQIGHFEGGFPAQISSNREVIAVNTKSLGSETEVINLYRIDLSLDSLLRRACQRLKSYIIHDSNQKKTEQAWCEAHLGERWEGQSTLK